MSRIQSNPAAVQQAVTSHVPNPVHVRRQGPSSDQALMYAWSIGTTRAAERAAEKTAPRREECPPEVYIG